jgi:Rieske Fe-S protein
MVDRRSVLKALTVLPVAGVAGGVATALLSYLRPTLKPLEFPRAEGHVSAPLDVGGLVEFGEPWAFKEFTYTLATVEYTTRGKQSTEIPGVVVRLPNDRLSENLGEGGHDHLRRGYAVTNWQGETYSMLVVSRICPHLGCIFQYHTPQEVCEDFNFCGGSNNLFSCPCHLSVYDPLQTQNANGVELPGRVVSGPAPRPPFPFDFAVNEGRIQVLGYL